MAQTSQIAHLKVRLAQLRNQLDCIPLEEAQAREALDNKLAQLRESQAALPAQIADIQKQIEAIEGKPAT